MLAEWMADDLIALAESFHLDPDYLFREAVSVFAEALEEGGARQPPREVYRETH